MNVVSHLGRMPMVHLKRHLSPDRVRMIQKVVSLPMTTEFPCFPTVSATRDTAPPLFVFNGCKMPYRQVLQGDLVFLQMFANDLQSRYIIYMREAGGGVGTANDFI